MGLSGAHVAIVGANSYEWVLSFLAIACGGMVAVPVNAALPEETLHGQIAHSDAAAVIHDAELAAAGESGVAKRIAMSDIPALVETGRRLRRTARPDEKTGIVDPAGPALIMYTSGTTGEGCKGAVLSHERMMRSAYAFSRRLLFGAKTIMPLPLFHCFALLTGTLIPLTQGRTVFINRGPMELYPDMELFRPNTAVMAPMMLDGIIKRTAGMARDDARRRLGGELDSIFHGGAAANPALAQAFSAIGVRTVPGYGLTESYAAVSYVPDEKKIRPGCIGVPFENIPMRIDAPAAAGNGEVLIGEDYAMLGYYKNPAATQSILRDGWLHTGDIGRMDADGFFYITGRIKNLIILSNGENVSPEELEAPLSRSEYVAECLVHEDGAAIAATIYPGEKYLNETECSRDELLKRLYAEVDAINARNPMSRRIGRIILSAAPLPKVGSGKIKRG